ncbi:MAG: hypothetical protein K0R45_3018, partial [Pseudomonas sp.]|nr:hypothetical protein [Pseudomonas sp.]
HLSRLDHPLASKLAPTGLTRVGARLPATGHRRVYRHNAFSFTPGKWIASLALKHLIAPLPLC